MLDSPPPILYHYTTGRALFGIVETGTLWATNLHYLNDSSEFGYALGLLRQVTREMIAALPSANERDLLDRIALEANSFSRIHVFVTCFTEIEDSLSQWQGYSNAGRCYSGGGYSIGFDSFVLAARVESQGFGLRRCVYEPEEQKKLLSALLQHALGAVPTGSVNAEHFDAVNHCILMDCIQGFILLAPMIKAPHFCGEHEWRLVSQSISSIDSRWRLRAGRSMPIPYVLVNIAHQNAALPISKIVIGPSPHPGLTADAVLSLFASRGITKFGIGHSQVPYRDW